MFYVVSNDVDFVDKAYAEICDHSLLTTAVWLDWKLNI